MGQEQDGTLNSLVTTRPEHMRRSKLVFQVAQAGAHEKIEVVQVGQRRLSVPPPGLFAQCARGVQAQRENTSNGCALSLCLRCTLALQESPASVGERGAGHGAEA